MTNLICRLFIKNYKDPDNPTVRKKYGTLASIVGIITNILLAAMKLVIGIFSASVAIIADAANNFSDAGASAISLISFKLSSKPADRDHPFGHARIEYIASMVISFIIMLVGAELLMDSGAAIFGSGKETAPQITIVTIVILSCSIAAKLWLAFFYRKIAKKINSEVIKAASTDSLTDCISTAAALGASIAVKYTHYEKLDSIIGLIISGLIIWAGAKILNETKNLLLGEAPTEETVKEIKKIIASEPEVLGVHDMIVHNYGPQKYYSSLHAEVDGAKDIYMIHDKIDNLERRIEKELNIICTIHLDPIVTNDEVLNELRDFAKGTIQKIYPSLNIHDFRAVIGATHTNMIFDVEAPFEIKDSPQVITEKICEEIQKERPDCFCVITVDRC